ncbi:MAG: hypothetical protein HY923_09525 [Elusimicrobia bacterium]|nr:hypothetical protein [Elusimicrobiota bacterium]
MLRAAIIVLAAATASYAGEWSAPAAPQPNIEAMQEAASQARQGSDLYYFTKEEAAVAAKKFPFQPRTGRGFTFDADVPADIQKQMRADLEFIKGIAGEKASALHKKIFGSVNGADYTKFFETRVTAIGMNSCGSSNAVACVIPFRNPSKMWLTQNFIRFSHPQISRMMVVFHEARHTETKSGNWSHAYCPEPFKDENGKDMKSIWTGAVLAGEPACDETPLGSYGSSTIMLKNISLNCANCTDKVKMDAGLYADDQLGRIIDADAKRQMKDDFKQ